MFWIGFADFVFLSIATFGTIKYYWDLRLQVEEYHYSKHQYTPEQSWFVIKGILDKKGFVEEPLRSRCWLFLYSYPTSRRYFHRSVPTAALIHVIVRALYLTLTVYKDSYSPYTNKHTDKPPW